MRRNNGGSQPTTANETKIDAMTKNADNADNQPSHEELERAMREVHRYGYVTLDDGRRVEPDHPESPIRKAGWI